MERFKMITKHTALFDTMKANGFFVNPHEQVETFIQDMRAGENWYSNGAVEFKILKGLDGRDELVNFRGIKHPVMDEVFNAA